jgi:hypothetical protein
MRTNSPSVLLCAALCVASIALAETITVPPDSPRWEFAGNPGKVADYLGRPSFRLQGGIALLKDLEFRDGVIDVDIAAPPNRGFFGIHFRADFEKGNSEWVYLRPHKTGLDDAQQYTPILNGAAVWQLYNGPGFTAAVNIPADIWFHLRLEVAGAEAKLFVNDMTKPSLVMTDLKSGNQKGSIGLAGPAYFSNFQVRDTPSVPWVRHEAAMPAGTLVHWSLSPMFDALARNLEVAPAKLERDAMKWEDVSAEPPGFVVINRYRKSPEVNATFSNDFSKRLEPQKGIQVIYALAVITSDRDQVKKLEIGYSDDVSVFLNDQILYRGRSAQRFRDPGFLGIVNPENDAVYLPLKKGRNELLLAVSELTGGWGFICRLENPAGARFDSR